MEIKIRRTMKFSIESALKKALKIAPDQNLRRNLIDQVLFNAIPVRDIPELRIPRVKNHTAQ